MKNKLIIFDLDGTIVDSKEGILNGARYALDKMGIKNESLPNLMRFIGPPLSYSFSVFYNMSDDLQVEAVKYYREFYDDIGGKQLYVYEGMIDLLKELHEYGFRLAIASAKVDYAVKNVANNIGVSQLFEIIAGSIPNGRRSAKDELSKYVIDEIGFSGNYDDIYFIGDSKTDFIGADKLGLNFIAALYDREESEFEGCDIKYKAFSVNELRDILLS